MTKNKISCLFFFNDWGKCFRILENILKIILIENKNLTHLHIIKIKITYEQSYRLFMKGSYSHILHKSWEMDRIAPVPHHLMTTNVVCAVICTYYRCICSGYSDNQKLW